MRGERRKLDSECTEKKEDTVDGGENDFEIAMIPWMGKVINVILKGQYVKIYRNTRLSWLIMHLTIQKLRKITPKASGESNNFLIGSQKRT